ncbi:MAG: Uma2 family endonuclease [Pirellulales bacterium]
MASHFTSADGIAPSWEAPSVHTFSVDEFHQLAAAGVLRQSDRIELVDGYIYDMTPIGAPHATSVQKTLAALWKLPLDAAGAWHVRIQQPLTLANSEPQPDLAIVRGVPDDYARRHPAAIDVGLVIEVADASLDFDRGRKLASYAAEGISAYWIVDLANRRVEVFESPQRGAEGESAGYGQHRAANFSDELTIVLEGTTVGAIRVAEVLV